MMNGYLRAKGVNVAELRVGEVLKRINPQFHIARQKVSNTTTTIMDPHVDTVSGEIEINFGAVSKFWG